MLPKIKKVGPADQLAVSEQELDQLRGVVAPEQSSDFSVEGLVAAAGSYLERTLGNPFVRLRKGESESVSEYFARLEKDRAAREASRPESTMVSEILQRLLVWVSPLRGRSHDSLGLLAKDIRDALEAARTTPLLTKRGWLYQGFIYEAEGPYSEGECRLLVLEHFDRERMLFERLRRKHSTDQPAERVRTRIPEAVRIEVWRRDGGRCARCESRDRLEYDHIVPVSEGGGSTARNIELLCEACNRRKGANVG